MRSMVGPHTDKVKRQYGQRIQGATIHQPLVRNYSFAGSYSSLRRYYRGVEADDPRSITVLDFEPDAVAGAGCGRTTRSHVTS